MREPFVLDSIDYQLRESGYILVLMRSREFTAGRLRHGHGIERRYRIAFRRGFRLGAQRGRRRRLSGSQSIVLVVRDDIGQIDVPSAGMEEMPQSDAIAISVSTIRDDRQIRIRHLDSRSERQ